jgi:serine/threonine protein kinase
LSLVPGARLGSYEITAPIGVGGMGEVYRATDSNLKRWVAIKVLPAAVAGDAHRPFEAAEEAVLTAGSDLASEPRGQTAAIGIWASIGFLDTRGQPSP